jgi:penicillin-binding protein 1A
MGFIVNRNPLLPGKRPIGKRLALAAMVVLLISTTLPVTLVLLVLAGLAGPFPDKSELAALQNLRASEVYSSDGELLGLYYLQDRSPVSLQDISPLAVRALIATEDVRFYRHNGIDGRSMLRVLIKNILLGQESAGGGSTLSQQLAKNLFPRQSTGALRLPLYKIREMLIARRLEKIYGKDQILELYLNTVPFGENVFGIESASRRYFSVRARNLNPQQAATLIGMLKATSYYNPRLNPDRALQRRNTVIGLMHRHNLLGSFNADSLQSVDIQLNYTTSSHHAGHATHFREQLRLHLHDLLPRISDSLGRPINLYTDGLKIFTTLDADLQRHAEKAVWSQMSRLQSAFEADWKGHSKPWENRELVNRIMRSLPSVQAESPESGDPAHAVEAFGYGEAEIRQWTSADSIRHHLKFLNTGFLALSPQDGRILAWVGGISQEFFAVDHVNFNTKRQAGSAFKPIVYACAIEQGMDPCTYFEAAQESYTEHGKMWRPANSSGNYDGQYSLGGALAHSVNTVSVKLLRETGIGEVTDLASRMGIRSRLDPVLSLALGTSSVSLMELVPAYACFVNGGRRVDPVFLDRIEDADGRVLWRRAEVPAERVIREETSLIVREFLRQAVDQGTAQSLRSEYGLTSDLGGKTGTTQYNADGWFIGISPVMVAGCWVGGAYPSVHFRSGYLGQGARSALPIVASFLQNTYRDKKFNRWKSTRFAPLPEVLQKQIDCPPHREKTPFFESLFKRRERSMRDQEKSRPLERFFRNFGKKKKPD